MYGGFGGLTVGDAEAVTAIARVSDAIESVIIRSVFLLAVLSQLLGYCEPSAGYQRAMQSISRRAPLGSAATATVERAGLMSPKRVS